MIRQPIIAVLGHVDHGKTSFLDKIRQTIIAQKEAGGITQAIGTTEVPLDIIKKHCNPVLEKFGIKITIPGLLFIDTPGHEAFSTLRERGGSIADLAVLVVDINEGIKPQTRESLNILKSTKTPFIVALNKIDRIAGWLSVKECFIDNYKEQNEDVQGVFEKKFYEFVDALNREGFVSDRFDRIEDFRKNIAIVPISAKKGEGVPELLALLAGLAQQFLKDKLSVTEKGRGTVLEVKEVTGLGTTIDTIVYDGIVEKNDILVIGGKNPAITKIRALLIPEPLRDIRTEKKFIPIENCCAACGVKISAPGLENVIAGSPFRTTKSMEEAKEILEEMKHEVEDVEIKTEKDGLILKADTIGSLEALITIMRNYPIKEATIGNLNKSDVIKAEANSDVMKKVILCFNVRPSDEIKIFAKDKSVVIFESDIIYRLVEEYEKFIEDKTEELKKKELEKVVRPGKIKLLPGCIFRASNPAVVGCEVLGGVVKAGAGLLKNGKYVGEIKQLQSEGKTIESAKISDKIAVSITGVIIGRQVNESDELYTDISTEEYKKLIKYEKLLSESEKSVLEEIKIMKRKIDPRWGLI